MEKNDAPKSCYLEAAHCFCMEDKHVFKRGTPQIQHVRNRGNNSCLKSSVQSTLSIFQNFSKLVTKETICQNLTTGCYIRSKHLKEYSLAILNSLLSQKEPDFRLPNDQPKTNPRPSPHWGSIAASRRWNTNVGAWRRRVWPTGGSVGCCFSRWGVWC